jgi:hypothetical protein
MHLSITFIFANTEHSAFEMLLELIKHPDHDSSKTMNPETAHYFSITERNICRWLRGRLANMLSDDGNVDV